VDLPLPDTAYSIEFDEEGTDGHAFGRPPGLLSAAWPRARSHGLPMAHLFTVRVPEPYRCAGPDLVGLSVFQADDHFDTSGGPVDHTIGGGDPPPHESGAAAFWSALTAYANAIHPWKRYRTDGPLLSSPRRRTPPVAQDGTPE
jgi:hypothetical protein